MYCVCLGVPAIIDMIVLNILARPAYAGIPSPRSRGVVLMLSISLVVMVRLLCMCVCVMFGKRPLSEIICLGPIPDCHNYYWVALLVYSYLHTTDTFEFYGMNRLIRLIKLSLHYSPLSKNMC